MHALLDHLAAAGMATPLPLGLDSEVETVTMLPGDAGADAWRHQATMAGLKSAARLLRRIHDATVDWVPPAAAVWAFPAAAPTQVILHGDPGPWNMTWTGGVAIGLFDWDFAYPGPRLHDVAYALDWSAPFCDDQEAIRWRGFTQPPDRAGRIQAFCAAYGTPIAGMVDEVIDAQRRTVDQVAALAAAGVWPQRQWLAEGVLDKLQDRVRWSVAHRHLFIGADPAAD